MPNLALVQDTESLFAALKRERELFKRECTDDVPGILGTRAYAQRLIQGFNALGQNFDLQQKDWFLSAVGGFGRLNLSFASDLDILIVHKGKLSNNIAHFIHVLVQGLWDAGFEVGHTVSSPSGLKKLQQNDFAVQTNLLQSSLLFGDNRFYADWREQIFKDFGPKKRKQFLQNLMQLRKERLHAYRQSAYLLEPNIKEGLGGLRDVNSLEWLGLVFLRSSDFSQMSRKNWISEKEGRWLEQGLDFLWRVRLQLHQMSGRRQDQLMLQDQKQLAKLLGFGEREDEANAIEGFMRLYYRNTSRIQRVFGFVWDKLHAELMPQQNKRKKSKVLPGPLILEDHQIKFPEPELVSSNPGLLMQVFWQAAKNKARFYHNTGQIIRDNLSSFSKEWREKPEMIDQFLTILLDPENSYRILKAMMETGFLETFLPEFSSIRYRMQYDVYHMYTVDEHLLRTVRELHKLQAGAREDSFSSNIDPAALFPDVPDKKKVLFLAGLIHDLGKGRGKGHSAAGAELAVNIGTSWSLASNELQLLRFLVEKHLLLAETALKRDLSDEKPVERCALELECRERLDMLYLLTIADSKATGPQVWNNWRSALLNELYVKVRHFLEDERWHMHGVQQKLQEHREHLSQNTPAGEKAEMMLKWLDKLSLRYILTQSSPAILRHYQLEQEMQQRGSLVFDVRSLPGQMWELTIVCKDQEGLFDNITGVLWLNGVNILSADIYTRSYGLAVDILIIDQIADPLHADSLWSRLRQDLEQVLVAGRSLQDLLGNRKPQQIIGKKPVVRKEDQVLIDEQASDFYTVVEVHTWERPGVLHCISKTLHNRGLAIQSAKIATPGAQVVDVFYVTWPDGNKILDPGVHQALKHELLQALSGQQGSA